MEFNIPSRSEIPKLLRLSEQGDFQFQAVGDEIEKSLIQPIQDMFSRPGKQFRGKIVEWGYRLGSGRVKSMNSDRERQIQICARVVEWIHAGSLIVDDIEDNSEIRRGAPTLHRKFGVPIALNAGNWCYFWPFEQIRQSQVSPEMELELYRVCHQALLRAHFGQAIDIGVPIDQMELTRIPEICRASLELKTGALMGLAMEMGVILSGATPERRTALCEFGERFGVALQMFDDLGNLTCNETDLTKKAKHFEDLMLRRPSYVWWTLVDSFRDHWDHFHRAIQPLPDQGELEKFLGEVPLRKVGKQKAVNFLNQAFESLEGALGMDCDQVTLQEFRNLGERLAKAYD